MLLNDAEVKAKTKPAPQGGPKVVRKKLRAEPVPQPVRLEIETDRRFLPAAKAALGELRDKLATKMEGAGTYQQEDEWVAAHVVVSKLYAAIYQVLAVAERGGQHARR